VAAVSTYEITLLYADRPFDKHSLFLQEVGRSPRSGLIAYHRYRGGVVLTIQVETDRGRAAAMELAQQRAAAFWPSFRPSETTLGAEAG
jgi:hypothetical protein